MLRRIALAVLCLVCLAPLGVSTPVAAAPSSAAALNRLFALAQKHHVAAGCRAWVRDARVERAAQLHAAELARLRRVSHVGRDGARVRDRLRRQGFHAQFASESIALYRTPEQSVRFWMSEGPRGPHTRNIISCQYTHAGVGVAYDKNGRAYWVMNYTSLQGGK